MGDLVSRGEEPVPVYIGVKIVKAEPTTLGEYNAYRGWPLPKDEDASKEVYLVEYEADPLSEPNHPDHEGYITMSPKHVFDAAYRKTDALTFGLAIEAVKIGKKITRKGWNGSGMFLELQVPDEHSKMAFPYPYFTIPGCDEGVRRIPYNPTIVDIMSEDWDILK